MAKGTKKTKPSRIDEGRTIPKPKPDSKKTGEGSAQKNMSNSKYNGKKK